MKIYAVIETSGINSEKIIGLYKSADAALYVAKRLPRKAFFTNEISRRVEVKEVK